MVDWNLTVLMKAIENRPSIWDRTAEEYKDKTLKARDWEAVYAELNPNYEDLTEEGKLHFGRTILRKWTNLRDTWMKSVKKNEMLKRDGSFIERENRYIYYKPMCFLKKIFSTEDDASFDGGIENTSSPKPKIKLELSETIDSKHTLHKKRKRAKHIEKINEVMITDNSLMENINTYTNGKIEKRAKRSSNAELSENRHLLFFKSILPSLSFFNDEQTLEFQANVLTLIQTLKKNHSSRFSQVVDNSIGYESSNADDPSSDQSCESDDDAKSDNNYDNIKSEDVNI